MASEGMLGSCEGVDARRRRHLEIDTDWGRDRETNFVLGKGPPSSPAPPRIARLIEQQPLPRLDQRQRDQRPQPFVTQTQLASLLEALGRLLETPLLQRLQ